MRGRPARGYRRSPKIVAIEDEYGMTFPEVIAAFAADGCNQSLTAGILGFERRDFWRKLQQLKKHGIVFDWPDPYASRDCPPYEHTPARQKARLANLEKARMATLPQTKVSHEMACKAHALRMKGLPWDVVAYRLRISPSTLKRCREKYKVHDPLGNKLVIAAQRAFTQISLH